MTHNEFKPQAHLTLSNFGGIELMLNRSNDGVYYRFNYGQDNLEDETIYEAEIQYDDESEPYFDHYGIGSLNGIESATKYSLNEFIKVNF